MFEVQPGQTIAPSIDTLEELVSCYCIYIIISKKKKTNKGKKNKSTQLIQRLVSCNILHVCNVYIHFKIECF